jgi:hypothetical protein
MRGAPQGLAPAVGRDTIAVMNGWTLSTADGHARDTLEDQVELELLRIAETHRGDMAALNRCPYQHPRHASDPAGVIRVGDAERVVACDGRALRRALAALPDGALLGTPGDAAPGSVWAALLACASTDQRR